MKKVILVLGFALQLWSPNSHAYLCKADGKYLIVDQKASTSWTRVGYTKETTAIVVAGSSAISYNGFVESTASSPNDYYLHESGSLKSEAGEQVQLEIYNQGSLNHSCLRCNPISELTATLTTGDSKQVFVCE